MVNVTMIMAYIWIRHGIAILVGMDQNSTPPRELLQYFKGFLTCLDHPQRSSGFLPHKDLANVGASLGTLSAAFEWENPR